jgi:hypothetical protein
MSFTIGSMNNRDTSIALVPIPPHRLMARAWVAAVLILPMPLLFHRQFVLEVMIPMRTLLLSLAGF